VLGYELVGNKFGQYVSYAYKHWKGKEIYVHCWRGGLRSNIMGNLLSSAGFTVKLIKGGYKTYRAEVLNYLAGNFEFKVLGGYTGSGKTDILKQLEARGAQVLDIEGLASHRGSAFGSLGLPDQPRQEHFENLLYEKLRRFSPNKPIWIEDESRLTGKLQIPDQIYAGLRSSFVYFLDYPIEKRAIQTLSEYGNFEVQLLAETTLKLRKRMGDLVNREAIQLLQEGDKQGWVLKVLSHYDKQYDFGFSKRSVDSSISLQLEGEELIQYLLTVA
jgi:tRNA 2-selenouridine synthase